MAKTNEKKLMQDEAAAETMIEAAAVDHAEEAAVGPVKTADLMKMLLQMQAEITALKSEKAKADKPAFLDPRDEQIGELSDDQSETVMFTVPFNEMDPKDMILDIGINGHHFRMRRGETVEVPKFVVMNYMDSVKQKAALRRYQEKYEKMVNLSV